MDVLPDGEGFVRDSGHCSHALLEGAVHGEGTHMRKEEEEDLQIINIYISIPYTQILQVEILLQ